MIKARFFFLPIAAAMSALILYASTTAHAHRLSGRPTTLQAKLELAKRQVAHDRRTLVAAHRLGWTLLKPLPFETLLHRWWLQRDLHYVRQLERQLNPRNFVDGCTAAIVDRENPGWDPGRWNTQGSGAFGLPQAKPYWKMPRAAWPRSAGGREDPLTQLRWMVRYLVDRYGSTCAGLAFWNAHRWY